MCADVLTGRQTISWRSTEGSWSQRESNSHISVCTTQWVQFSCTTLQTCPLMNSTLNWNIPAEQKTTRSQSLLSANLLPVMSYCLASRTDAIAVKDNEHSPVYIWWIHGSRLLMTPVCTRVQSLACDLRCTAYNSRRTARNGRKDAIGL